MCPHKLSDVKVFAFGVLKENSRHISVAQLSSCVQSVTMSRCHHTRVGLALVK